MLSMVSTWELSHQRFLLYIRLYITNISVDYQSHGHSRFVDLLPKTNNTPPQVQSAVDHFTSNSYVCIWISPKQQGHFYLYIFFSPQCRFLIQETEAFCLSTGCHSTHLPSSVLFTCYVRLCDRQSRVLN